MIFQPTVTHRKKQTKKKTKIGQGKTNLVSKHPEVHEKCWKLPVTEKHHKILTQVSNKKKAEQKQEIDFKYCFKL